MDEIYEAKAVYFDEDSKKEAEWYASILLGPVETWAMVIDDDGNPFPERTEVVGGGYNITFLISYDEFSKTMKKFIEKVK